MTVDGSMVADEWLESLVTTCNVSSSSLFKKYVGSLPDAAEKMKNDDYVAVRVTEADVQAHAAWAAMIPFCTHGCNRCSVPCSLTMCGEVTIYKFAHIVTNSHLGNFCELG